MKYELELDNNRCAVYYNGVEIGEITFVHTGPSKIIIDHTYVDDEYRGQHIAQNLLKHVVDYASETNKKIIPLCPFARREFDNNKEYQKLEDK